MHNGHQLMKSLMLLFFTFRAPISSKWNHVWLSNLQKNGLPLSNKVYTPRYVLINLILIGIYQSIFRALELATRIRDRHSSRFRA